MQASRKPSAVEIILKSKIDDIKKKHAEITEAVKAQSDQVTMTEQKVSDFVAADNYTAKDALTLAVQVDQLLDILTKCHQALTETGDFPETEILNMPSTQCVPISENDNSTVRSNSIIDSNSAAVDVLTVQVEVLQQQMSSLQDSQDSKFENLDLKIAALDNRKFAADIDYHIRLQNLEAKLLLIQDVQVRDDATIQNAVGELSTQRIDIISLQDNLRNILISQNDLQEKHEEVKNKVSDLVTLQQILNDLHSSVSQREELTRKLNELEENVNTINCLIANAVTEANSD